MLDARNRHVIEPIVGTKATTPNRIYQFYYSKPRGEQQSYRDLGIGTFHFFVISNSYSRDRRESEIIFLSRFVCLIGARVAHTFTTVPTCLPFKTQDLAPTWLAEEPVDTESKPQPRVDTESKPQPKNGEREGIRSR